MPGEPVDHQSLAAQLEDAWQSRQPILPPSEQDKLSTIADAYQVQMEWNAIRLAAGDSVIGRKIGLTSKAVQDQLGVDQPDFGNLWSSRLIAADATRAEASAEMLIQPRVEGELAFRIGGPLRGPGVTLQEVLAATDAVAAAFEVVDSRIADWRITIADTIADDASFGALCVGRWTKLHRQADLRSLGMIVLKNGRPAAEGVGAAALGHPARAVAWLVNKLAEFEVALEAGDIVMSGALAKVVPAARGDIFTLEMGDQSPLSLRFT